jgi:hypothetical protein
MMEMAQEASVEQQPSTRSQVFAVRVTEAVVIAIVAASLSVWGTTQVLSERMNNMQRSLDKVESKVEQIYRDVYAPRFMPQKRSAEAVRQTAHQAAHQAEADEAAGP